MPMMPTRATPALFFSLGLAAFASGPAFAVGSDDPVPPTPTETTTVCEDGMVWNPETELCVTPTEQSGLSDDLLYDAVREFAYAGRYDDARRALDAMSDPEDDRVLTYRGFLARVSGDMQAGLALYAAALDANPDNLLARAYLGQAYVLLGDIDKALDQLAEIGARGGAGTWPELALLEAIETKVPSFY